jgi:hypothetical protein
MNANVYINTKVLAFNASICSLSWQSGNPAFRYSYLRDIPGFSLLALIA